MPPCQPPDGFKKTRGPPKNATGGGYHVHNRLPWPIATSSLPPESQPLCTVGDRVSAVSLPPLSVELEGGQKS
ncbi:hypothetical protein BDN70DRAFT_884667 [Pholiota conissans]|uniref:Uncharacterized protein n=1 Tax=Pholiota conissans TaxID=109636 RepID=A0A9P6CV88_9AGAR|nr:hypothetical protein BDN70DRAFT_884667 [Pholiota conissans]